MSTDNDLARTGPAPRKLSSDLIARLTEAIVAGKLAPRTRLPTEHALMETFGVSRTVVREAIAALRAEGLVETRQGSGAYVATGQRPFRIDPEGLQSIGQVLDVMELRIAVEVEAAGLAAANWTRATFAGIEAAHHAFIAAIATGDEAIDQDFEFHAAIGAATGNPYFLSFLEFLGRLIIPRRSVHISASGKGERGLYMQKVCDEHVDIIAAIEARDVAAARRAMRSHLKRGRERYRRAAEAHGGAPAEPPRSRSARRAAGRRPR